MQPITLEQARDIAAKHIRKTNPNGWDGNSPRPDDVDTFIEDYPIGDDAEIGIYSAYFDKTGWIYVCELRNKAGGTLSMAQAPGIGNVDALAAIIRTIYNARVSAGIKKGCASTCHACGCH